MPDIEGLQFKISADADDSAKGVKALTRSLNALKKATAGGLGLKAVCDEFEALNKAIKKMDAAKIKAIGSLGSLKSLNSFDGKHVAAQLDLISESLRGINGNDVSKVRELADALRDLNRASKAGGSTSVSGGSAAGKNMAGAESTTRKLRVLTAAFNEVVAVTGITYPFKRLGDMLKWLGSTLSGLYSKFKQAGGIVGTFNKAIGGVFKLSARGFAAGIKAITSSLASRLNPMSKKSIGRMGQFFNSIKRIAMYRAIRMALNAIAKALKEGINNMYAYSKSVGGEFATNMNSLATSAKYLTNSLGAMAAPLINALTPAINTVIDQFVQLLNVVNMFIARLTGASTYTAATRIETAYGNAASSAAQLKKYTSDLDELNIFDKDSGGGSGGSAGAGGMFTELPIEQNISNFANSLKEAFQSGDWNELGKIIGDKINEIVEKIDFAKIGSSLGKAINGAVQTAYSLLSTIDFHRIGERCAELINNALQAVDFTFIGRTFIRWFTLQIDFLMGGLGALDWRLIGQRIGEFFIGALDEINDWIKKYDWKAVGTKIWDEFVNLCQGIDWGGVATSLFSALGTALGAAVNLLDGFLSGVWEDVKSYFTTKIEECGGNVVAGLWKGISDAFVGAYNWIKDNVVDPFVSAFKDMLGIHSPSTVMAELGDFTILGFLNALAAPFVNIGNWVTTHIIDPLLKAFTGVTLTEIKVGIANDAKEWWGNVQKWWNGEITAVEFFAEVAETAGDWWDVVVGWWNGVTSGENTSFYAKVVNTASDWWDSVVGWWNGVKGFAGHFMTGVLNKASEWWSNTKKYWAEKVGFAGHFTTNVMNESSKWWGKAKAWWLEKVGFAGHFLTNVQNQSGTWWGNVVEWWRNTTVGKYLAASVQASSNVAEWWDSIKRSWNTIVDTLSLSVRAILPTFTLNTGTMSIGGLFNITYPTGMTVTWGSHSYTVGSSGSSTSTTGGGGSSIGGGAGRKEADVYGEWMDDITNRSSSVLPDVGDGGYSVFKAALADFYAERMETTVVQMASDVQRQADKKEQTVVQIDGREIATAVSTQQSANGYVFAK